MAWVRSGWRSAEPSRLRTASLTFHVADPAGYGEGGEHVDRGGGRSRACRRTPRLCWWGGSIQCKRRGRKGPVGSAAAHALVSGAIATPTVALVAALRAAPADP